MWGTNLKNVYIKRVTPNGVDAMLEEEADMIRMFRDELMILAASTPRDVNDGDMIEAWEDFVARRVGEAINGIMESAVKQYQLYLIKDSDPNDIEVDA